MIVWPLMLLFALPPLWFWWRERPKRPQSAQRDGTTGQDEAAPAILQLRMRGNSLQRLYAPPRPAQQWRFWGALGLLVLALTRPQWQAPETESTPAGLSEIVVVLEVSPAMLARDLLPSRLERARAVVLDALDQAADASVALIGYAGDAYLLASMSSDQSATRRLVENLAPRHFANPGADLAAALTLAEQQFSAGAMSRLLLLVSTGEQTPGDATAMQLNAERLSTSGVRLLVVGVGTAQGAALPTDGATQPASGITRLQRQRLQTLADSANGGYVEAAERNTLQAAVQTFIDSALANSRRPAPAQGLELFSALLLGVMLLLTLSLCREYPGHGLLALQRRMRRHKGGRADPMLVILLGVIAAGQVLAPAAQAQSTDVDRHPGDPYEDALRLLEHMAKGPSPGAEEYRVFAETVAEYALFHRNHAHPLILSLLDDGFIAVEQGRQLDGANPVWDALQQRLERLARRAPAAKPPDPEPGDPANERVDADAQLNVAGDPPAQETEAEAGEPEEQTDVGGGQADVFDESELENATLILPLHQLQAIREQASPADLFRARQLEQQKLQAERAREGAPSTSGMPL